jgi:outer membrane protein insertion porin family
MHLEMDLVVLQVKRRRIWRSTRRAVLGTVCAVGCACLNANGWAQGSSAGVPVTGGQNPGQVANPSQPAAVPQAANQADPNAGAQSQQNEQLLPPLNASLTQYAGLKVTAIDFDGVEFAKNDPLLAQLPQQADEPLDTEKVRETTRRLFATGRYRDIGVRVERTGDGVTLIFQGVERYYVGRVQITGIQNDQLTSLVEYGTKLNPGTAYTNDGLTAATDAVKQVLAQAGYYEPVIAVRTERDPVGAQVNVTYTIAVGPQAKVGKVTVIGSDPGISQEEFIKRARLITRIFHHQPKVTRDTATTALSNMREYFQKRDRLEATVQLQKSTYDAQAKALDYEFAVNQGPIVKVVVDGAKFSKSRLHLLVPVFEEGTVDIDLLNEGSFNMKDYLQQEGFFDAKVSVGTEGAGTGSETVRYTVTEGVKHKVAEVDIAGNKYFGTELLKESLKTQKADAYLRSGRFSNELVKSDASTLQSIYRANGFDHSKITSTVTDTGEASGKDKVARITVKFNIEEGPQQTFGKVNLTGMDDTRKKKLQSLLQAEPGQPFSLVTLSGDRDAVLGYYLSNGFDQAKIEVAQTIEKEDASKTDVSFNVTEGEQVTIGKVLQSGIHYTRPTVVNDQVLVHAGNPLDQSALLETQRNLYNLALFNEVVAAVQNPQGDAQQKNVLVQITEAKRWDVTYGFGFEVQTGIPACQYCTQQGTTLAQQGKAGASPRVSLDVSRINVRGTDDSLTLHTEYGLLEKIATLTFQNPHFEGHKNLALQISGGYSNVQDITTFQSSKLQGDFRITQKASKKDTFIYDFQYRRVAVNPASLAIAADLIPLLSEPVRVGGPGITWFHDTRVPSPLDAQKGSYTSVQEFWASSKFGSQTSFSRTDITNSTYYAFGKRKYVFARETRVGFIASYGVNPNLPTSGNVDSSVCGGILATTNASCNAVPLPERLYAGGATSHRGFVINGAGPRDLQTGYPVGGSAVFVNSFEMRFPAPLLPIVGDNVSFVLFHDMGNVFDHVGDMFPSFARFHQPDNLTCEQVTNVTIGTCNFNYFSHAVGLGLRYKTPVGPIRVDLSYNLNPPRYPVIPAVNPSGTYFNGVPYLNNQLPTWGQASHFNFFFSIGQSF